MLDIERVKGNATNVLLRERFTMLELPIIPKVGEVFLAVELTAVQNMTVAETLKLLEGMGYNPTLRYRQFSDGKIWQ